MIVLDASAIVELVVEPRAATSAIRSRLRDDPDIHVPHLADAEATGATLPTRDARLARATGHRARVDVV